MEKIELNDVSSDIKNEQFMNAAEENVNENTVAAETAEAAKENAASATGKFKDVHALMSAYKSLEAEFTRRSQKLKELEEKERMRQESVAADSSEKDGEDALIAAALTNDNVRQAVIGDYLKTVSEGRSVPLILGGVPCAAPLNAPKTVKEAGALAKQFLKN